MIDAEKFNITVRKDVFDGEVLFEAKIKELPDVCEYADTHEEAYSLAIDTIETTAEIFEENGQVMPLPIVDNDDFSGRVTLRMPKSMHASYSRLAHMEEISLNQMMLSSLAYSLGHNFGYKEHHHKCVLGVEKITGFFSLISEKQAKLPVPVGDVTNFNWGLPIAANDGGYR